MKMHPSSVKELSSSGTDTKKEKDYEDIISYIIGDFGKWQLQLTFLLSLFNIPCTWHIYAPVFLSLPRDYWCSRPSNLADLTPQQWRNVSQPIDQCSIYNVDWGNYSTADVLSGKVNTTKAALVKCTSWEWSGGDEESIVSQWNLVCDRKDLVNVAEMMFLIGVAFGGLVGGIISDHYGRKRTLMASLVLQIIIGTAIAFTPWLSLYLFLRMSLGFFSVSVVFSGFVLALEIVGGKWRAITGISYLFPVSIGYISISGIAYLLRDWRDLQLAISLPGILMLGLYWVLPESPRWYLALGEKQKVVNIIQTAVVVNKRKMPENIDKLLIVPGSTTTPASETKQSAGVMDLFRTKQMRKNTLLLFVIWFAVYLVYYGLVLNMTELGGNVYINTILSGLVEVPALAASILFLRGGRRWPFCLTLAFAGAACLVVIFITGDDIQWLTTSFAMVGKLCISSSNAVMPVFTAELYPTVIRNLGVGASNVAAGIALILVPYLWLLSEMRSWVPMLVLGVCGIIGGLCVLPLPETGNRPLAGTLEDQQHQQEAYQNHQHHNNQNRTNHHGSISTENNSCANNLPEEKLQVETFTIQPAPNSLTDTRL